MIMNYEVGSNYKTDNLPMKIYKFDKSLSNNTS